ncbi:MAG: hypothetical protein HYU66_19210 [Armatimonadetes bacterium]|nr:hypothetical protein [Armatimonadota bacterium]
MLDKALVYWHWVEAALGILMAGLPVMLAVCLSAAVRARRRGDEALARSWADAARSFGGMMVSSWLLLLAARWAWVAGEHFLARLQSSG